MRDETIAALEAINTELYDRFAAEFSRTREAPWPGWTGIFERLDAMPAGELVVIDAGAGNGRLGAALARRSTGQRIHYLGIDTSRRLLDEARARLGPLVDARALGAVELHAGDVTRPGALDPLPAAALVAAMGLFHHVPAEARRIALARRLAAKVGPGGILALSLWRFGEHPRFRNKILPWTRRPEVDPSDLEPGDHLLPFGDGGRRYCHALTEAETDALIAAVEAEGLVLTERLEADGATSDLNRYLVFTRPR